ncbi:MAG TPA: NADP-dependent oxidoreductase, partial [Telluria sp.]|nr:NADP-dependent oxidoreductase [Telluria sp.]
MECRSLHIIKLQLPATMGSDLAGVVVETGSRVTRFKAGNAVFASTFELGVGALAEYAAVPEHVAALKRAKVATTTSTANVEFVRQLGADEVIDYKKQAFEALLRDYDVVLATLRGGELEKSLQVVGPGSKIISLIGPPDAAFARNRGMNFLMKFVFGLLSGTIIRRAKRRKASYSFLFVRPDGQQLAKIGDHLAASRLHPVVDKIFPFAEAREGLAYLAQGRAKGNVV